ncbi:MAG: TonB-dependent receptor [Bacteroidota bacterium]
MSFFLVDAVAAQERGVIRGRVVDAVTQEALPGANVIIPNADGTPLTGAATTLEGTFEITGLTPGTYSLRASLLGYQASTKTDIVVQTSRPTFVLFELEEAVLEGGEIVVEAGFFAESADAPTSVQVLGAEEIRRTPGGQNDISRTLLALPGVGGGIDIRNDLLVRGGGPSENAYIVDGIEIPQINHFATQGAAGGPLGLLNVDFIRETEFYTGGFPVRYGDAASSVLVINNRPGSPGIASGDFTLGATDTALSLDGGPSESFNWLFSVRRSYLQFLFELLELPIRPAYWDTQTRLEYNPTIRDRIVGFGVGAIDDFDIVEPSDPNDFEQADIANGVLDNDQRSYTVGVSWRRLIDGGFFTLALSRSYQDFAFADIDRGGVAVLQNNSTEVNTRLRLDGDKRLSRLLTLGFGGGITRGTIETAFFQVATPATNFTADLRFQTDAGLWLPFGYGQLTKRSLDGRLTSTLGLRLDANTFLDNPWSVSPRLSTSYAINNRLSVNAAAGLFTQSPEYLSLGVRDEQGGFANAGLSWIDVYQLVGGVAFTPMPSLRITVEGYYKFYENYPISASDPRVSLANLGGDFGFVGAEPLLPDGQGRTYGLEVFAQRKLTSRFYGLAAYTLGWSEFSAAGGRFRPSGWDVRHSGSFTGGYRLGGWEIGAKIQVQSGRPYTPFDLEASAIEYARTGRAVLDRDRLNALRTPYYARVDLRVDRRFDLGPVNGVAYLDIQNLFNRENLFGFEYTQDPAEPDFLRDQNNVGLLPNLGFSIEF